MSARKFLDAALQTGDRMLFFTVFRCFQQRNQRLRGSPAFNPGQDTPTTIHPFLLLLPPSPSPSPHSQHCVCVFAGEHCEEHVTHFKKLFGDQALMKASTV